MLTLIHYGELSLKGRNRSLFEGKLIDNIQKATGGSVKKYRGRLVLDGGEWERLDSVFGISWYARALKTEKSLDVIKSVVLRETGPKLDSVKTFGVYVKRADKDFPVNSVDAACEIGNAVKNEYGHDVDLKQPDLEINVEIAEEVYIYFERFKGLGGFPVGVSGRVLCLLSGGIDSPVASYLMLKRGCTVDFIHFHVFSDNEVAINEKIKDITQKINLYQHSSNLYLVPYYLFEMSMLKMGDVKGYELILFRRYMVRVAERLAKNIKAEALVTGDSLGQVASQTLSNISAVKEAVSIPLLQPLISYDKQEIVDLAKIIGSYEVSIAPYKDCCSIVSSHPKTKTNQRIVNEFERKMDIEGLVKETMSVITKYGM